MAGVVLARRCGWNLLAAPDRESDMSIEPSVPSIFRTFIALTVAAVGAAGCDTGPDEDGVPLDEEVEGVEVDFAVAGTTDQTYSAQLASLNADLLDASPSGEATLEVRGDSVVITVTAEGLPPEMMHLQHFHGFEDGSAARCPTADADENGDGVVDVTETAPLAGTTMVPFHDDPANMEIQAETYPRADGDGEYRYRQAVPVDQLEPAFEDQFGGRLALHNRVVFIHGVPEDMDLPETVESKAGLPAHATLPIACGELASSAELGAEGEGGS